MSGKDGGKKTMGFLDRLKDPVERARLIGEVVGATAAGTVKAAQIGSAVVEKAKDRLNTAVVAMTKPKDAGYREQRERILANNRVLASMIQISMQAMEENIGNQDAEAILRSRIEALYEAIRSNMMVLTQTGLLFGFREMSFDEALQQCGLQKIPIELMLVGPPRLISEE